MKTLIKIILSLCLFVVTGILLFLSQKDSTLSTITNNNLSYITIVEHEGQLINLPYDLKSLEPRTAVSISTEIIADKNDVLYFKSVYAPAKIYMNDVLIYEYGNEGTYPDYMIDPPTGIDIIELPTITESSTLRIDFLSPISRDTLVIHPPMIGQQYDIIFHLFCILGFPLLFALLQILVAILLILFSTVLSPLEKKGSAFFWLGLFSLSTGLWHFGEYNLTAVFIKNFSLLYLISFMGLFFTIMPLIRFTLSVVDFKHTRLLFVLYYFFYLACIVALILQLLGKLQLSTSMYFFHLATPIALLILSLYTSLEAIRYKNRDALRLLLPLWILFLSGLVEVFSYSFEINYAFSSFFQFGIGIFIIITILISSFYLKDSMILQQKKRFLEHQVQLMEVQVEEHKKYNLFMAKNIELSKQQQHDLRHQLKVIRALGKDSSELTDYVDSLIESIPSQERKFCENLTVNAIVTHFISQCHSKHIDTSIHLIVPPSIPGISDSNLCVIFGNLLENALEAFDRNANQKNFLRLHSRIENHTFVVTMDNSFNGDYKVHKGRYLSSKRNDYGIGLSSIISVAKAHGGNARFEKKDELFQSSIYLKTQL